MNFRNVGSASGLFDRAETKPDQCIVLTDDDLEEVPLGDFEAEDTAIRQVDLTQEAVTRVLSLDETEKLLASSYGVSEAA